MKLTIDKIKLDESVLTLLELYLLLDTKNSLTFRLLYDFLINSDLIEQNIYKVLVLHYKGECYKAYESFISQSDTSNMFFDKLMSNLLYIEFLNFISATKYSDDKILQNSQDKNTSPAIRQDGLNITNDINNRNNFNSYFGCNNLSNDQFKESFIIRRQKYIKIYTINLDKIKSFKIQTADISYIQEEINYTYKQILKLLKEYKILKLSKAKEELDSKFMNTNNPNFNKFELKISEMIKFNIKNLFLNLKFLPGIEDNSIQEIDFDKNEREYIRKNISTVGDFINNCYFSIQASKIEEMNFAQNMKQSTETVSDNLEINYFEEYNRLTNSNIAKHKNIFVEKQNINYNTNANNSNKQPEKNLSLRQINSNIKNLGSDKIKKLNIDHLIVNDNYQKNLQLINNKNNSNKSSSHNNFTKGITIMPEVEDPRILLKNKIISDNFSPASSFELLKTNQNKLNSNTDSDVLKIKHLQDSCYSFDYQRTANDQEFLLKLKIFNNLKTYTKYSKNKKAEKLHHSKKETIAKIFYNNLLKSRTIFGFIKFVRNKKFYEIIENNFNEWNKINLKNIFLKLLIFSFNRKKLLGNFLTNKDFLIKQKVYKSIKSKLSYRIQSRKLYFAQLSDNEFAVEFFYHIINIAKTIRLPIRKNSNFNYNFNIIQIKKEKIQKLRIFKLISNLLTEKIINEKNQINLVYNIQTKFQKLRLIRSYWKLFNIKKVIYLKKLINNFQKKLFLMRYYYKKYSKEASLTKIRSLKKGFWIKKIIQIFKVFKRYCQVKGKIGKLKDKNNKIFFLAGDKLLKNDAKNFNLTYNSLITFCDVKSGNQINTESIMTNINRNETNNNQNISFNNEKIENYFNNNKLNNPNINNHLIEKDNTDTESLIKLANLIQHSEEIDNTNKQARFDNLFLNKKNCINNTCIENSNRYNLSVDHQYNQFNLKEKDNDDEVTEQKTCLKDLNVIGNNSDRRMDKESNIYNHLYIVKNSFAFLKKFVKFKINKQIMKSLYFQKLKTVFFKNMRILCIRSLISQAIREKYNILKRKIFINSLIRSYFNKKKIEYFKRVHDNKLKKILFCAIKALKGLNSKLIVAQVKFCVKLLFLKIAHRRLKKQEMKKIIYNKFKVFNFKVFLKKLRKVQNLKISIKQKLNNFIKTLFFKKIFSRLYLKSKLNYILKKPLVTKFKSKVYTNIKQKNIDLLRKKFILIKYFKWFLKNTFNFMDKHYYSINLKKINRKRIILDIIKMAKEASKNKKLTEQIIQYSKLKKLSKIFKSLKKNYLNQIKFKMVKENYKKYLIINYFKFSIQCIIKKNNK